MLLEVVKKRKKITVALKPEKQQLLSVTGTPQSLAGMSQVLGKFKVLTSSWNI